jgi:fructosamine-3-kinase
VPTLAEIERAAGRHVGRRWVCQGFTDLDDRASHPAGILHGERIDVFAKLGTDPVTATRFATELAGLRLLAEAAGVRTAIPVAEGVVPVPAGSLLLLEALPERAPSERTDEDWRSIGRLLATLHQARADRFGLSRDAYFGPLHQDNRPAPSGRWADFYRDRRVLPLLATATASGHLPAELAAGVDRLADRLPELCGPEPAPSLLHGDAQQNNFVSAPGGAVPVDPAPYYGHPEIDLALIDYFAPVPADVLTGYRQLATIDPGFAGRRELWRVFGYLAVITVDGGTPFGRRHLARLADAVRRYG